MNRGMRFMALWVFVLGMGISAPSYADVSTVKADHLDMAVSYERKAKEQATIIDEHTQMKADYKKRFFINEKVTPLSTLRPMEDHCNALIQDASKLRGEYLEFAKWHRMTAAALEGK